MTFTCFIAYFFKDTSSFKADAMLGNMVGSEGMVSALKMILTIVIYTFTIEIGGAIAIFFCVDYCDTFPTTNDRIYFSIFNAISAFCNAGIDIISEDSLCPYVLNPMVNFVTSLMVILGGIGYIVWWDVIRIARYFPEKKFRCFSMLSLHSKLALTTTTILLIWGTAGFFAFEYHNPLTIGNLSFLEKIQVSFFQSMTTRTAGFASVPQQYLTNPSAVFSLFLMFIGGSPVGTAGGVKTVTMAVLMYSALAAIQNRQEVSLFKRRISRQAVSKAVAVVTVSFMIMFISMILLSVVTNADIIDIAYETVSATATVGLTRNLTSSLNSWGKIIIIITMYLGRVGPISLLIAFNTKKNKSNIIKDPVEEISIG